MVRVNEQVLRDPTRLSAVAKARAAGGISVDGDAVARLAARLVGAPAAMVTVVADQQENLWAAHGLPATMAPLASMPTSSSVSAYAISEGDVVSCGDMPADATLRDHPLYVRHGIRAFLAVPWCDGDGVPVGCLTVLDSAVRQWSKDHGQLVRHAAQLLQLPAHQPAFSALAALDSGVLLESVQEAFLAVNRAGVVVGWNRAAQDMLGYSAAQVCGRHVDESLFPSYAGQPIGAALERLFTAAPRRPVSREVSLRHHDGRQVKTRASMSVLTAATEPLACAFLTDLTRQAAAEDAAERHSTFLAALLDSLSVAVVACDEAGQVVFVNRVLREVGGLVSATVSPGDIPVTVRSAMRHPDLTPMSWEQTPLMRALRGEHVQDTDVLTQSPGARLRIFASTARPITAGDGRLLGAVAVAQDVTALRRTEQFQACHLAVARALAAGAEVRDAAPHVLQAVARTLGWPYAELWLIDEVTGLLRLAGHWSAGHTSLDELTSRTVVKGAGITGQVWATGRPTWVADLADTVEADNPQNAAHLHILAEQGIRSVLAVPVHGAETLLGVLTCYAGALEYHEQLLTVLLDGVAAQLGTFIEARRAADLTRQLDRSKDDFLALVGHEMRTPLTAIAANTALLADDCPPLDPDSRHMIQTIERNTTVLCDIVDTLLDLAALDNGHHHLSITPTDLTDLISRAVTSADHLAVAHEVRITADLPEHAVIDGDAVRLQQAIDELLCNAIKYSHRGGAVLISLAADTDTVELSITDDGIGIPAAEHPHLFDRFYRASNVRHHGSPGNGLGLSLARTIIHLHGGTITLTDRQPAGTLTTVRVPRQHEAEDGV